MGVGHILVIDRFESAVLVAPCVHQLIDQFRRSEAVDILQLIESGLIALEQITDFGVKHGRVCSLHHFAVFELLVGIQNNVSDDVTGFTVVGN